MRLTCRFVARAIVVTVVLIQPAHTAGQQARDEAPEVARPASLRGRAVVIVNGTAVPVRRAHVTLESSAAGRSLAAETDIDGQYRFDSVPPASYRVAVVKPGLLMAGTPEASVEPLRLGPGEAAARDVVLEPAAAIEGRLLTEDGEPAVNFIVSAVRLVDGPGGQRSLGARTPGRTDDLGRFRIHTLPAGEFYLEATPDPIQLRVQRPPNAPAPDIPKTFYPGTAQIDEARAVRLARGQEARGLDFAMTLPRAADPDTTPAAAESGRAPSTAASGAQSTGRISGRVTAAATGRAVRNALIRIVRWEGGTGSQQSVNSDAEGRFAFERLAPGSYQLTVRADGYVPVDYGQRTAREPGKRIELHDGQQFETADLALFRPNAIEGRVVDELGDPAPGILIQVARPEFVVGKNRLMPLGGTVQNGLSDDTGRFRVWGLPPGDYVIVVLSGPFANEDRAGFAPTFFPGTTAARDATPIHLDIGQDRLDIVMPLVPAPAVTLSGRITGLDSESQRRPALILLQTYGGDVRAFISARGSADADGSFRFRNVPAGDYVLQAMLTGAGQGGFGGFGSLAVSAATDLDGLTLTIGVGATLRGRISFEGDAAPPPTNRFRITPRPVDFVSGPAIGFGFPAARIGDDWTFEAPRNLGQGVLRPEAPAPWALRSITLNGVDVTDATLDFRGKDIDGLEIVMTSRWPTLTGKVSDQNQAVADYSVVVFAEDRTKWTYPSRYVVLARPSQDGTFTAAGLPPATYLLAALPSVGTEWQDPQFLDGLRGAATRVVLSEDVNQTIDLRLVRR